MRTQSAAHKIKFETSFGDDQFGRELRDRVSDYFDSRQISDKANALMVTKSVLYLAAYFVIYGLIISNTLSGWSTMWLWASLGFLTAGIGFNIGHDALHGAYAHRPWLNSLLGNSFVLLGANTRIWKILHNLIHHSFTNIAGADGDLYPVKALRFHHSTEKIWMHRFQNWYAPVLYCFTSLVWVFRKDYSHFFKSEHCGQKYPSIKSGETLQLFMFKGLYYIAFLIIPLLVVNLAWWQILIGFLCLHAVAGFSLAIVFQLGHLVEGPDFDQDPETLIEGSWMVHQLRSAANFSTNNKLATWFFGGLNFQIEHHLFPKICHIHYPALAPIVRETATKYGLPYHSFDTFFGALRSHIRLLKKLGRD